MPKPVNLWAASFSTAPEAAEFLSEALDGEALSLTILNPPRAANADIEAIFDAPPNPITLQMRIDILAASIGVPSPKLAVRELPKLDWLKKVAADFPPLAIARWVVFGAHHKEAAQKHRRIPLQIDATSAFGTGEHPTTRGCMLMLDLLLKRGMKARTMLDMGCGSGILAMAYAKAAHGQAIGVDIDTASIEIAKGNSAANGLTHTMRMAVGNGYHTPLVHQHAPYDLVMANIFAGPLCRMAYSLKQHVKPGGTVILSGLLAHQANRVIAAHRMQGLALIRHMKIGEWSVLAFTRASKAE